MIKIIGKHKLREPEECLMKLEALNAEMEALRPYKKQKGIVLRFKTYDDVNIFTITRAAKKL